MMIFNLNWLSTRRLFLRKTTSSPQVTSKPFQRITHFLNNLMPYLKRNSCRRYYRKSQSITFAIRGSLQNQFTTKVTDSEQNETVHVIAFDSILIFKRIFRSVNDASKVLDFICVNNRKCLYFITAAKPMDVYSCMHTCI